MEWLAQSARETEQTMKIFGVCALVGLGAVFFYGLNEKTKEEKRKSEPKARKLKPQNGICEFTCDCHQKHQIIIDHQ